MRLERHHGARKDLRLRAEFARARKVDFYLDDRRQTRAPARTDRVPPFDLAGTARNRTARPFDTTKLVDGSHTIKVVLTWRGAGPPAVGPLSQLITKTQCQRPQQARAAGRPRPRSQRPHPRLPPALPLIRHCVAIQVGHSSASASQSRSATHSASASSSGSTSMSQPATTPSSPSGSPTATTVTPTPPAATLPAGNVCTSPVWRSSSNGAMYSDGGFIVHNNMWNTSGYRVSETVEVCSYHSWNAIATADNSSGDGAVKTYANVHKDYHNWTPAMSLR